MFGYRIMCNVLFFLIICTCLYSQLSCSLHYNQVSRLYLHHYIEDINIVMFEDFTTLLQSLNSLQFLVAGNNSKVHHHIQYCGKKELTLYSVGGRVGGQVAAPPTRDGLAVTPSPGLQDSESTLLLSQGGARVLLESIYLCSHLPHTRPSLSSMSSSLDNTGHQQLEYHRMIEVKSRKIYVMTTSWKTSIEDIDFVMFEHFITLLP